MTTLTAPAPQANAAENVGGEPINLYRLGMLFVIRCRYWSCRAGNDPDDLDLSQDRIDAKAIASFGSKDLLDPAATRKVFQAIEKKARHVLEKHSRPFAAANAHFVPWNQVQTVIEQLEALRAEFEEAVQRFLADYSTLRAQWQAQHPEIPEACYPLPMALPGRFGLSWSAFRVSGAPELTPVEDIELELEQRRARDEQVRAMEANLRRECQQFVEQYVLGFRHEVATATVLADDEAPSRAETGPYENKQRLTEWRSWLSLVLSTKGLSPSHDLHFSPASPGALDPLKDPRARAAPRAARLSLSWIPSFPDKHHALRCACRRLALTHTKQRPANAIRLITYRLHRSCGRLDPNTARDVRIL